MSYEKLKREKSDLQREINGIENICSNDWHIYLSVDPKRVEYCLVGDKNSNRQPDEHEKKATAAIKAALIERAIPLRERMLLIEKRLNAADELLKEQ